MAIISHECRTPLAIFRSTNGLGLCIVKIAVDLHAGSITADSAPGQGCTFHIDLPPQSGL